MINRLMESSRSALGSAGRLCWIVRASLQWTVASLLIVAASARTGVAQQNHRTATRTPTAATDAASTIILHGTVLRPDGQPAAGALVLALRNYWTGRVDWRPLATARAGADGEFELRVPPRPDDNLGSGFTDLCARADGFGTEWTFARRVEGSKPIVLTLVPESPIRGRVVDSEERPISGVRVRVREQIKPTEGKDLSPWLEAVKEGVANDRGTLGGRLPGHEEETQPPIISDRDGRFTVRGIGAERVVQLQLSGETIASAQFEVANRKMNPIARNAAFASSVVFGNNFTYQAESTKPLVGTIRDVLTGKPLPRVRIEMRLSDFVFTESDAEGRFRLVGMPKMGRNETARRQIVAAPASDQPYFETRVDVPYTAGLAPVTLDIKLKRGLWITGRVTDKVTGEPVRARVLYYPHVSNSFVTNDEWRNVGHQYGGESSGETRADGTYRILGLPGRGIVGTRSANQVYRKGFGASEIAGVSKDGRLPTLGNAWAAGALDSLKEINPQPGTESIACDLALDPGGRIRLTLVDSAGKPVENTYWVQSSTIASMGMGGAREATFEVGALNPNESRTYLFTQQKQKIAKLVTLGFDKPLSALTITLVPSGTVQGRIVDETGHPLKNVQLTVSAWRKGKWLVELIPFRTSTDSDGRFVCGNLAVGCDSYRIDASADHGDATIAEKVEILPGKTIDLGDVKFRPKR
jgi:Carboxypeptidase regulatory-like domain